MITNITESIIHIQFGSEEKSSLVKFGIIAESNLPSKGIPIKSNIDNGISIIKNDKLIIQLVSYSHNQQGSTCSFKCDKSENWFGFGDFSRDRIFQRGNLIISNIEIEEHLHKWYIPVPVFISTLGYMILVNTTYKTKFDMCHTDENIFSWQSNDPNIDFYVLSGKSYKELLDMYTDMTGKCDIPPLWTLGLRYSARDDSTDVSILNDALEFRRNKIPCDTICVEASWTKENYDCSMKKEWHPRFKIPYYDRSSPSIFTKCLSRMNFHTGLWINCDHDFTNNEISWFDHLEQFVDQEVSFFKQDADSLYRDHPDKKYHNGMTDKEAHNLMPQLWNRHMYENLQQKLGKRPSLFYSLAWIGSQRYCGMWAGDIGLNLTTTLLSMINVSLLGNVAICNDMGIHEKETIHIGFLLPWSQINSWNYCRQPWFQGDDLLKSIRFYANLRSRLIPYIYSYFREASLTGCPVLRSVILEYPEDQYHSEWKQEYFLGRDLLVCGAMSEKFRLPPGKWKCFFTCNEFEGGQVYPFAYKGLVGGGLFLREGAIVPLGQVCQYVNKKSLSSTEVIIYPSEKESSFELYEDDGETLNYLNGEYCLTKFRVRITNSTIEINISKKGNYPSEVKILNFKILTSIKDIKINGKSVVCQLHNNFIVVKGVDVNELKSTT